MEINPLIMFESNCEIRSAPKKANTNATLNKLDSNSEKQSFEVTVQIFFNNSFEIGLLLSAVKWLFP